MPKKYYLVYKICHPENMKCIWVGVTSDPGSRFTHHMVSSDTGEGFEKKRAWVTSLSKEGLEPVFVIVWWTHSKKEALIKEARLMRELTDSGHTLFNVTRDENFTPTFRKPVKDSLGRVYPSILDAEKQTGATRKGIALTIQGKQAHAKGLKFSWATLADLAKGVSQ